MALKTYSLKKDGNKALSENFKVCEFKCNDGSDKVLIDTELVAVLQNIRNHFGKAVTINSAYRSPVYNKKVGGVSNSQHVKGTAADICISGVNPKEIAQYAEYIMPKKGGIGLYDSTKSGRFVHIDVRANRARWTNYGNEVTVSGFSGYTPKIKELTSVNDIVCQLHNRGIISNTALWLKKLKEDTNAYWLAYKGANLTVNRSNKTSLETVNDIVWELNYRKILTDTKLWLDVLEKDADLYWLANKICNMTCNKGVSS